MCIRLRRLLKSAEQCFERVMIHLHSILIHSSVVKSLSATVKEKKVQKRSYCHKKSIYARILQIDWVAIRFAYQRRAILAITFVKPSENVPDPTRWHPQTALSAACPSTCPIDPHPRHYHPRHHHHCPSSSSHDFPTPLLVDLMS